MFSPSGRLIGRAQRETKIIKCFPFFQGNVYEINHACKRAQGVANLEDYGSMPNYCQQLCINLQHVIEELCHSQTLIQEL
jgi:hypothetical protein